MALALLYTWDGSRQPVSGSGWDLIVAQRALGQPRSVTVLTDQAALVDAWDRLRLIPDPPTVDFSRHLVVWFVDTGTFGCRSRLDGVAFDRSGSRVTGLFGRGLVVGCDDEANIPDSFLVQLDRDRLPEAPFRVILEGRLRAGETAGETLVERLSPAG